MVVKAERGRRRYVLFEIDPEFTKESLIAALRKKYPDNTPFVIQVAEQFAIIRCAPKERDEVIEKMMSVDPKCHSITTSGTLITIRNRFPVLKVSKKP